MERDGRVRGMSLDRTVQDIDPCEDCADSECLVCSSRIVRPQRQVAVPLPREETFRPLPLLGSARSREILAEAAARARAAGEAAERKEKRRLLGVRLLIGGVAAGICAVIIETMLRNGWGWLPAGLFCAYEAMAVWFSWPRNGDLA